VIRAGIGCALRRQRVLDWHDQDHQLQRESFLRSNSLMPKPEMQSTNHSTPSQFFTVLLNEACKRYYYTAPRVIVTLTSHALTLVAA
jgi:hypothetical protein